MLDQTIRNNSLIGADRICGNTSEYSVFIFPAHWIGPNPHNFGADQKTLSDLGTAHPKRTKFRTSTLLLCGLILSGLLPTFQTAGMISGSSGNVVYTQSHVTTTNDQTVYESSFQNFGFYAQGRYWVFYEDSSVVCEGEGGCLFYTSSTNGTTWTAPRNVGIHVTDSDWSIVTNSTYIFYARYNETSFDSYCNKALLFGYGAVGIDGTIAWQPEHVVRASNMTVALPNEVVRVDSKNEVWIGYQEDSKSECGGTGIQSPHIIHSGGTDYSGWTGDTILSTAHSNNWDIGIAPLSGGRVYAIYWINSLDLHGRLFNGTSWGPDEQISSPSDSTDVNSFVFASGSNLYAIWHDANSGMLRLGTRPSSSLWTVDNIGQGEVRSASSVPRYSLPITATFDPSSSTFYIFWYNATRQAIDQWSGNGNSWNMTRAVFSTAPASGEYTITSFNQASLGQNAASFGVMWVDQTTAPYSLNFGLVRAVPSSSSSHGSFFDYVLTILLENEGLNDTYGPHCRGNCTYIMQLANSYSLALDYSSIGHPSLPNYIGLTGGGNYDYTPFDQDCYPQSNACLVSAPNLVDSIDGAGLTWRAYMEDYTGGCTLKPRSIDYINSHNPFVYYTDIYNNSTRCANIVDANPGASGYLALPTQLLSDLGSTRTSSNYMWLTPNLCDNGHNSCTPLNNTVSQQNQYLSILIPEILNSFLFTTQRAALFVTWDESTTAANSIVTAIWAGPASRTSYKSAAQYTTYSAVRTIEDNWNLPTLTSYDFSAVSMREFLTTSQSVGGQTVHVNVLAMILPILVTAAISLVATRLTIRLGTANRESRRSRPE